MIVRIFVAAIAASSALGAATPRIALRQANDSLSSAIDSEDTIAFQGVLNNIGPDGLKAARASAGVVIASPSTVDPDYHFTWTRDAALIFKALIDAFLHGEDGLRTRIQDFVQAQAILQTVANPSGSLYSGAGLGEPKFYSNLTRFDRSWGRPQRDGPALRAIAVITYANWLLASGHSQEANTVWGVIQNDLNYVAQFWNSTGFDLWEEVRGSSFWTIANQHRALVEGATLGSQLGYDVSHYESQAPLLLCFLQTFWNGEYIVANVNTDTQRSGIDANTVLSSIATFDPEAGCDDTTFQPCSHRALANLKVYTDSFRTLYPINAGISNVSAIATGRYAEDVYYGGNPWYLTTLAVSEQLYDAVQQWSSLESITISDVDLAFWVSIYPAAVVGTYDKDDPNFQDLIDAALATADAYVQVALKYTPSLGALSEQFSRDNGTQVSAADLTWSYASFVTMNFARNAAVNGGPQVPSWGAPSASQAPSTCAFGGVSGTYTPDFAAGAPQGSGGCYVVVTFDVNATTFYGENISLTGNTTDLGRWAPGDAIPGYASDYTDAHPLWFFIVELPEKAHISYSYVRAEPKGTFLSETKNRTLTVPACASGTTQTPFTVRDAWVGPTGSP